MPRWMMFVIGIYVAACSAALLVYANSNLVFPFNPYAGFYAVLLGLPWSVDLGRVLGGRSIIGPSTVVVFSMLLNVMILAIIGMFFRHRAASRSA